MSRCRPCFSVQCSTLLFVLLVALPLGATVSTVFSCPVGTNQDSVSNGFEVTGLIAVNIHTVTLNYTSETSGLYSVNITLHSGSYGGPQLGSLTQNVSVTAGSLTPVTWTFANPAFTSGGTLAVLHSQSGPGDLQFNMQSNLCGGDFETVGTSSTSNGFSVSTVITENITPPTNCVPSSTTLCVDDQQGDKRFAITATYATVQDGGRSGNGEAIQLNTLGINEGGLFWFFSGNNPEVLIKVLNGCGTNSHHWVFFSALTNVGFKINVTDTKTSHLVSYTNHDTTTAQPVQDTSAFPCP